MSKGIFVTATGTDVGKTYISALLVKKMREQGFNCGYYKPALSGAYKDESELIAGDCEYVLKTANLSGSPNDYASYIFETAVSPHLAAKIENNPIKLSKIIDDFEKKKQEFDYIVVEGAGGIVCPFNSDEELLLPDMIKALNLDVVIVAGTKLGSINSAVLTSEYAKGANLNVKGFIINNYDDQNFMEQDNKEQIQRLSECKILAEVKTNDHDLNMKKDDLLSIFGEI